MELGKWRNHLMVIFNERQVKFYKTGNNICNITQLPSKYGTLSNTLM